VLIGPVANGEDDPAEFRAKRAELKASPHWHTVFDSAGITVLKRQG
jgi:hypothetical protein